MTSPSKNDYLTAIATDGKGLIAAIRQNPDAIVPHYPAWTGRDLAEHTAGILSRTAKIATERVQERVAAASIPEGEDAVDWLERCLAEMLAALRAVDSAEAVWCFLPDGDIRSWERRMTVEVGVHRWDAEQAVGTPDPLPDLVATSGLDEFPEMFLERLGELPTLELRATDSERRWTYGPGAATLSADGSMSDLYLRLMARPGADVPEVWGAALDAVPTASG